MQRHQKRIRDWREAYAEANDKTPPSVTYQNGHYCIYHESNPTFRSDEEMKTAIQILKEWKVKSEAA